jgi:hypothetical protein
MQRLKDMRRYQRLKIIEKSVEKSFRFKMILKMDGEKARN